MLTRTARPIVALRKFGLCSYFIRLIGAALTRRYSLSPRDSVYSYTAVAACACVSFQDSNPLLPQPPAPPPPPFLLLSSVSLALSLSFPFPSHYCLFFQPSTLLQRQAGSPAQSAERKPLRVCCAAPWGLGPPSPAKAEKPAERASAAEDKHAGARGKPQEGSRVARLGRRQSLRPGSPLPRRIA